MEAEAREGVAQANHVSHSGFQQMNDDQNDEEEVAETDPEGRYYRYNEVVGRGRFKQIFKAFDTQIGIDVAWSKICAEPHHLSEEQLDDIVAEMAKGLDLEHPNIIKCFKCWEDHEHHCINLITELFTSGNLRQYRNLHKHLDLKAVKRMARQILKGLDYLHTMSPPVVHGDLRCDKIYVNGHSGEIKIGDLGLATLMPLRWEDSQGDADAATPASKEEAEYRIKDVRTDIFAFGLCMLELLTLKQLDPQHFADLRQLIEEVGDEEARTFIASCVGLAPLNGSSNAAESGSGAGAEEEAKGEARALQHPAAVTGAQLLEDPFLQVVRKTAPSGEQRQEPAPPEPMASEDGDGEGRIAIGKLRGEDYNFEFHGKVKEGKMHFRLYMTQVSDSGDTAQPPVVRTIDFVFDPDVDTADNLATEISEEFALSPTDTEICAAALREWLAKEMPGISEGNK